MTVVCALSNFRAMWFGLACLVALIAARPGTGAELKVVTRPEIVAVLAALGFAIEEETGASLAMSVRLADEMVRSAVEPFDVIVADERAVLRLIRSGKLAPASLSCIAYTGLALVGPADAATIEIDTPASFRDVLRTARSIAVDGNTRAHLISILDELGIAPEVLPKLVDGGGRHPVRLLAAGAADLAVVLQSDMRAGPGARPIGPFPPELQRFTAFYAALSSEAAEPDRGGRLIALLSSFEAIKALHRSGLDTATTE